MSACRYLAVALTAFWLLVLAATPAAAMQPEREVDRHFHVREFSDTACAFPFFEEFEGHMTITTYFDQAGTPTRIRTFARLHVTLINEANGKSLSYTAVANETRNLDADTRILVGLHASATLPGAGTIFLDAGRIVFERDGAIFVAGPHQLFSRDFAEICAALGD